MKRDISDRDLMLLADGELDVERAQEVDALLLGDATARQKLAMLRLAGQIVREDALARAEGFDIADKVMKEIEASPSPGPVASPAVRSAQPANDNSRRIFALSALAVAAAAGFMIWGRLEQSPAGAGARNVPTTAPVEVAHEVPRPSLEEPAASPTADIGSDVDVPSQAGDVEVGVQVAAVDFGSRTGAVFYVPVDSALSNQMTTVVWLADELGGGKE